jgi:hypothetical protein
MDAKLTLKLDPDIINKAKSYAAKHGTSLSALVESYFDALTAKNKKKYLSEELTGCVKNMQHLSDDDIRRMYLKDKHGV